MWSKMGGVKSMNHFNILVVGGTHGIGLSIARILLEEGHQIFLVGKHSKSLYDARIKIPNIVGGFAGDLSEDKQIDLLYMKTIEVGFKPNILVLSAAEFGEIPYSVVTPSTNSLRRILDVNVISNYGIVKRFIDILKESSYSRIIIVGSTAALRRDKGGIYGISKWALRSYAYMLRDELRKENIGVTLINPGGTFTERRVITSEIKENRLLETEDIAKTVSYVIQLSPQAVVEEVTVRPILGDTY